MNAEKFCDRIIRTGFYLLFILVPLILTPFNYELFEYNKMMLTYGLTAIITVAWLAKMALRREFRIARTPFDIPILLFLFSQFISALYSIDPHISWFGYYSRFNGGLWSVISYTLLFYAFVTNFVSFPPQPASAAQSRHPKTFKDQPAAEPSQSAIFIMRLIKVMLFTGAIVSAYGILERLGIDKSLWVQDVQNRVFSTLGQPNWLAAYLVALIPVAMAFALKNYLGTRESRQSRIAALGWTVLSAVFFVTLLFTRSRSGLLAFAVTDVLFWLTVVLKLPERWPLLKPAILVHLLFFLIVFVNGTYIPQIDRYATLQGFRDRLTKQTRVEQPAPQPSGTLLEYGGTESGTIRKYVWQAAVTAWRASLKNTLIGTGTETFAWTFFRYRPVEHNLVSEWDFLYNKAHNEYLNYLATTGIFGLGSYLVLIGVVVLWFLRFSVFDFRFSTNYSTIKSQNTESDMKIIPKRSLVLIGLFSGWVSILITNFFGFSVVIIQLFLFLFPAILYSIESGSNMIGRFTLFRLKPAVSKILLPVFLIVGGYVLVTLIVFWRADTLYASGYRFDRQGQYANAKAPLEQAVALNPGEPLYHDELAGALAPLVMTLISENQASQAAELAQEAIRQNSLAIAISPENVNFWKTRTKIFYTFSDFNPEFNDTAISALQNAKSLSPNDPRIYYNLAILYGRKQENDQAISLLKEAKKLKANYRDAYFGLYVFYTELNQKENARAELTEYLSKVNPGDAEFKERLKKL